MNLTGQDILNLLEQQSYTPHLFVSGLRYEWDGSKPQSQRVVSVQIGDRDLERTRMYGACINEFLAEGSEGFTSLASLPRLASSVRDVDALESHVRSLGVLTATTDGRIRRVDRR